MANQQYPQQPHEWTMPLPAAPDRTAELPALPAASFWDVSESGPDLTHEFSVMDEDEPKHQAPRNRRRLVVGLPWFLVAGAVALALVSAVHPFGKTQLTFPSPTAQPAPAPVATRTVRVTPPPVTVAAAPRPAETVYRTSTVVVTKTPEPKPAATVTVTATTTVTAEPAPENKAAQ